MQPYGKRTSSLRMLSMSSCAVKDTIYKTDIYRKRASKRDRAGTRCETNPGEMRARRRHT